MSQGRLSRSRRGQLISKRFFSSVENCSVTALVHRQAVRAAPEQFFRFTGQLAQPNKDFVFSKRTAFFNGLKNKVGHIMARASAFRVILNL